MARWSGPTAPLTQTAEAIRRAEYTRPPRKQAPELYAKAAIDHMRSIVDGDGNRPSLRPNLE